MRLGTYGGLGRSNFKVHAGNGVLVSHTVNSMNQYTAVGGEPLSYDANGKLTTCRG